MPELLSARFPPPPPPVFMGNPDREMKGDDLPELLSAKLLLVLVFHDFTADCQKAGGGPFRCTNDGGSLHVPCTSRWRRVPFTSTQPLAQAVETTCSCQAAVHGAVAQAAAAQAWRKSEARDS